MMNNEEYVRAQFSLSQRLAVFITTQLVNDTAYVIFALDKFTLENTFLPEILFSPAI